MADIDSILVDALRSDKSALREYLEEVERVKPTGRVSVKFFGAVGDGTTDDLAAIHRARDHLVATHGGGVIVFPPGIYGTSGPIVLNTDNLHIEGAGHANTIIRALPSWTVNHHADGASQSGIVTFVGVNRFSCTGIRADSYTNTMPVNGIIAIPTGTFGAGTVCTKGFFGWNEVWTKVGSQYHIWGLRAQELEIAFNIVNGHTTTYDGASSQEGIELYGGIRCSIHHNDIQDIGNQGINIGNVAADTPSCQLQNIRIHDNSVKRCGNGVILFPTYAVANGDMYAKDVDVHDNIFDGVFRYPMRVLINSAGVSMENVSFHDNTVRGPASGGQTDSRGFYFDNQVSSTTTVTLRNLDFSRNKFIDIPLTDSGGAIHLKYLASGKVNFNQLLQTSAVMASGSARGLFAIGCVDSEIIGNTIDGARSNGMQFSSACFRLDIVGNNILNWNLDASGGSGMTFSSSGTGLGSKVFDNNFDTSENTASPTLVNLGSTGVTNVQHRGTRYLNKNANIGTNVRVSRNADRNWATGTTYARGEIVKPTSGGTGLEVECVVGGTSHASTQPTWANAAGAVHTDNTVTWKTVSIY